MASLYKIEVYLPHERVSEVVEADSLLGACQVAGVRMSLRMSKSKVAGSLPKKRSRTMVLGMK